ncbi:MAG: glycerophosphodiester phosphodiesterase family protein, partial [Ilumatobacteraceae bacterium]
MSVGLSVKAMGLVAALVVGASCQAATSQPGDVRGPQQVPVDGSNPFRTGHTLVIPHGGGDGLFPEDTMLAYDKTMAMGADVVDVDLRLTADHVLIAFHDPTTDRITGTHGLVADMTFDQLSHLDAGWSFVKAGSDSHPFRGAGVTIPTFESLLDRFPRTLLSLDLKDESENMVQPLCSLLVDHHKTNDVFVGSNNDAQILSFRKQCPTVRT